MIGCVQLAGERTANRLRQEMRNNIDRGQYKSRTASARPPERQKFSPSHQGNFTRTNLIYTDVERNHNHQQSPYLQHGLFSFSML